MAMSMGSRAWVVVAVTVVLGALVACAYAAPRGARDVPGDKCAFCGNCSNHNTCVPSQCGGCPTLLAASQQPYALIMKVNWTNHDPYWGFNGEVLKMYTGSNTQRAVGVPPQQTSDPCFTGWLLGQPYIVAMSYSGKEPPVLNFQPNPNVPECFYLSLNQCNYFKLVSMLTPDEIKILSQYGPV